MPEQTKQRLIKSLLRLNFHPKQAEEIVQTRSTEDVLSLIVERQGEELEKIDRMVERIHAVVQP